jgi:hypothetical protein
MTSEFGFLWRTQAVCFQLSAVSRTRRERAFISLRGECSPRRGLLVKEPGTAEIWRQSGQDNGDGFGRLSPRNPVARQRVWAEYLRWSRCGHNTAACSGERGASGTARLRQGRASGVRSYPEFPDSSNRRGAIGSADALVGTAPLLPLPRGLSRARRGGTERVRTDCSPTDRVNRRQQR